MVSIAWILFGIVLRMTSCSGEFHKGWLSAQNTLLTKLFLAVHLISYLNKTIVINHHSVLAVTIIFSASESALILVLVVPVAELMQTVTIWYIDWKDSWWNWDGISRFQRILVSWTVDPELCTSLDCGCPQEMFQHNLPPHLYTRSVGKRT